MNDMDAKKLMQRKNSLVKCPYEVIEGPAPEEFKENQNYENFLRPDDLRYDRFGNGIYLKRHLKSSFIK